MTEDPVESGLRRLGITIAPEWLPAIRFHLDLSLAMGAMVAEFPLPDEADPAPVFRA